MHGWRLPPGKTCLSFKTMKDIKIADPNITRNSFTTKMIFYKKKL